MENNETNYRNQNNEPWNYVNDVVGWANGMHLIGFCMQKAPKQ